MSNKKFGKKLLAVAMATAMAATMLVGCGDKATTTTPDSSVASTAAESSAASTDAAPSGEVVTIKIFRDSFNVANPDEKQVKAVQDAINEYIKDKINVQIELTDVGSGEYTNKANLALSNGEINMMFSASWMEVVGTDLLITQNAVYDITDLLKGTTLESSIPEWVWPSSSYNNRNYFIPCYKESAEGYDLMFRQDLVDKYGWDLSSIKTLKDIEPMLADCKSEGLRYPYLSQKTAMFFRYYLDSFDFVTQDSFFGVDRDTNTIVDTILTDEYKEFCTLMCEWGEKGYISEDDVTKTTTDTTTQTQDWGVSWWTDLPNNNQAESRYQQKVAMVPITGKYAHSTTTLGSCWAIAANSTEAEAKGCIEFLGLVYTDKVLADLFTYGIEGTDYDRDESGKIVKKGGLYDHSAWESCSQTCVSLQQTEVDNLVELYEQFNANAIPSVASGFRFDKSPVEAEYTALRNVFQEYGFILENGGFAASEVEAKIAEYQAAMDEAGYQKVLAELQSQYEAWKAGN